MRRDGTGNRGGSSRRRPKHAVDTERIKIILMQVLQAANHFLIWKCGKGRPQNCMCSGWYATRLQGRF
jgi:hypothetical protein